MVLQAVLNAAYDVLIKLEYTRISARFGYTICVCNTFRLFSPCLHFLYIPNVMSK